MTDVACDLCPHRCVIPEGAAGDCRVRVNLGGRLRATTYGRPSAIHIDPMEKKPLYHFLPAASVFSIGTAGCNMHCRNCQNWQLSQRGAEEMEEVHRAMPDEVVALSVREACRAVAYTYNDPVVFYEYVEDTATRARQAGLRNVLVTAAFVNREPLRRLCRVVDAATVDVKAFDERFYREICGTRLSPVLEALVTFREEGIWLEVSNLLIPSLNDDLPQIRRLAKWVRDELGGDTPFHFLGFRPMYRMRNLPATPSETLERARREALDAGLRHVYIGNLQGHEGESTYCPRDGTRVIHRIGFRVVENLLAPDGSCPTCRAPVAGVWR